MANYRSDFQNGGVNPYNFVQLSKTDVHRQKMEFGSLSGVIHCTLRNTRPLCIPDLPLAETIIVKTDRGQDEHKKVPFFRLSGQPVIAGSELRGMLRSAFEALSNSCLSVNNNNVLTARSSDVRKPGILCWANGKWHLYEATAIKCKDGIPTVDNRTTFLRKWPNYRYFHGKAQYKEGKHLFTWLFTKLSAEVKAADLEIAVQDYNYSCELYLKNDTNKGEIALKKLVRVIEKIEGKGYPVFYLESEINGSKRVYLSPAQISRSVFHQRVDNLLGSHCRCKKTDSLCPACRLFGMIPAGNSGDAIAVASRLRISDAVCSKPASLHYETLQELSSPKLSAVEFYSHRLDENQMKFLWNYDQKDTELNGRKYYFHHKGDYRSAVRNKRNMTAEIMDEGAEFQFDIYFDRITRDELRQLVWAIAIGENKPDGVQQHKLGHGKPLGLGSVKITVDSVIQRTFDSAALEYSEAKDDTDYFSENPFAQDEAFRDFMNMTNVHYLDGKTVKYPYGDDGKGKITSTGTLVWFKANHNDGQMVRTGQSCRISYYLPRLADQANLVLPALESDPMGFGNRGGGYGQRFGSGNSQGSRPQKQAEIHIPEVKKGKSTVKKVDYRCSATKKCSGIVSLEVNPSPLKTKRELVCPVCGKKFTVTH